MLAKSSCLSEMNCTISLSCKETECEELLSFLWIILDISSFCCARNHFVLPACKNMCVLYAFCVFFFLSRERERERRRSRERSPQRKRSRERSPRRERERSPRRPRRVVPRYTVQFSKFSLDWYVYSARCLPTSHFNCGHRLLWAVPACVQWVLNYDLNFEGRSNMTENLVW